MEAIFFNNFEQSYIPEILNEIYRDRIYEPFLKGRKDAVIFDIGANIGLTTYYFSHFAQKVYSIEPAQQHSDVLREMVKYNKIDDKVEVIQKALFFEEKKMVFNHNKNETMFSLHGAVADPSLEKEVVESVTLSKLFEQYKIDKVDFLKLDIEGSETEVVGHSTFESVADKIQSMVVEYHNWSGFNPSQLVTTLSDYGFTVNQIPSQAILFGAKRE